MDQRSLEDELDAELPASVAALPDDERQRIAGLVDAARRRNARALGEAIDDALAGLPRPARAMVRKVLR